VKKSQWAGGEIISRRACHAKAIATRRTFRFPHQRQHV